MQSSASQLFTLVDRHSLPSLHYAIRHVISKSEFIAMDTEFTGLGGKGSGTKAANIQDRYRHMAEIVKSHALLSMGWTFYEKTTPHHYKAHNFNIVLWPELEFTVNPTSLSFLIDNGFDMNEHVKLGIPFTSGKGMKGNNTSNGTPSLHSLLQSLFYSAVSQLPVIVHNGLMDIMYLYHSLYAELPSDLDTFIADCSVLFQHGLFDTKYIAEYIDREEASFLAYLYRKYEREQQARQQQQLPHLVTDIQPRLNININVPIIIKTDEICFKYAHHGYCARGKLCTRSHDLDRILDHEQEQAERKRKKKKTSLESESPIVLVSPPVTDVTATSSSTSNTSDSTLFETYHTASFDAYMTAFIYARQMMHHSIQDHKNRLYLMGKNVPLRIEKSGFAKHSLGHLERIAEYSQI